MKAESRLWNRTPEFFRLPSVSSYEEIQPKIISPKDRPDLCQRQLLILHASIKAARCSINRTRELAARPAAMQYFGKILLGKSADRDFTWQIECHPAFMQKVNSIHRLKAQTISQCDRSNNCFPWKSTSRYRETSPPATNSKPNNNIHS